MIPNSIVFPSAGSFAVALLALIMAALQAMLFFRRPKFAWYGWGAAVSLTGMFYATGVFFEYNTPAGPVNRFAGLLEFSAVLCWVHCIFGFTFAYLGLVKHRYHGPAAVFHGLVLILLWSTDAIVSRDFIARRFIALAAPFTEAGLGPLGIVFEVYCAVSSLGVTLLWIRHRGSDVRHRSALLSGMIFWFALAVHDGLASIGLPALQYLMEYGFLGFCLVVLWIVFSGYADGEALDKYRMITEVANDGIVMLQDGVAVFANPACAALVGGPVAGLSMEDFLQVVAPADRPRLMTHYDGLLGDREAPEFFLVRLQRDDEGEKFIEIRAKRVQYKGKPAILAALRDVTQRMREEEAQKRNEEKLARMKKMESLGLMAGGVAHDLNNVLSGIVSYPELLLLDLPADSNLRKPIRTIQESGQRAVAIVQDLLTVARGVAIAKEALHLNTVVRGYLTSPECEKLLHFHPGVTVRENLAPDLLNINGSAFHIRKAVMNLVSNAAEAVERHGEVRISTMNRYLDRPLRDDENAKVGEYAVLVVEDNGPGIPAGDLQRIFEPFFTKKIMGRSGTGLGLTLVWNVLQDHEGFIEVTSDHRGTRFELFFPVTREAVAEKTGAVDLETLRGSGEAILVVDDVESQREISCRMLEKLGYTATAVAGGEAAVEYLRNHRVDLLLLDMIMDPGIDGRETYARIKQLHLQQKAIIVSGFARTVPVAQTLKMGAGEYLKKPLILESLGLAVKRELNRPVSG